jgi:dihydropteroate synthase
VVPIVRVVDASLGRGTQVSLVVGGVSDPDRLRSAWASSGAAVERIGDRLRAVSTVAALGRAAGRCLPSDEAQALEASARAAVDAWSAPSPPLELPDGPLDVTTPVVMGICNVTPDSFSDGGSVYPDGHPDTAVRYALGMVDAGARIIDVGGESTRPGSRPVAVDEELARVVPVVERLAAADVLVSIDTTKPDVARAAIDAGARIVNDVGGGTDTLLEVVAERDVGYVLMHTRGTPADMRERTDYDDVVAEVYEFLAGGLARCADAGVPPGRVVVDPGIGFAKTPAQSLALLRAVPQLRSLGRPVLIGASRKSFIGSVLDGAEPTGRLEGSLAAAALAVADGASVLRVHDVAETVLVVRTASAIRKGRQA